MAPDLRQTKTARAPPLAPRLKERGPALGLLEDAGAPALGELPDQGLGQGALPLAQGGEKVLRRAVSHGGTPS